MNYEMSFIRRSRGYAPDPMALHDDGPEVLGCGADLKNTFHADEREICRSSQHIGDMENYETVKFYEECSLEPQSSLPRTTRSNRTRPASRLSLDEMGED